MKIGLLLAWDCCTPDNPGGALGIWTWEVARRLVSSHEVVVCSLRSPNVPSVETVNGVRFLHFFTNFDLHLMAMTQRISGGPGNPDFASPLYYCLYALRAGIALRLRKCDIIHIFNLSQFAPVIAHLNPRAKIVLNMHCDWLTGLDYSKINSRLKYVDGILGCAQWITDEIRNRFPHYAERCGTVYNGADLDTFSPAETCEPDSNCTLLTIGRISPEKGLHLLLDAFERILEKKPTAKLRIIGPESVLPTESMTTLDRNLPVRQSLDSYGRNYLQKLRERVQGSLAGNVAFVGALPHARIAKEMRNAVVLVQPSVYDIFPLPVIEGMASGLPVVASRVGGLAEIVCHKKTGLLVEPGNPIELAEALLMLLDNPSKARAMGAAGRLRAFEKFSWEATVSSLIYYYESLI